MNTRAAWQGGRAAETGRKLAESRLKGQSIRRTLLAILLLTLLPLAVFTAIQGISRVEQDRDALEHRLADAALLTAYSEQNSIRRSEGLLAVLGDFDEIRGGSTDICNARLAHIRETLTIYSHLSAIGPDGRIRCASNPRAVGDLVSDQPFWAELSNGGGFTVTAPIRGRYSGGNVIWAVRPLTDPDGRFAGAITASIDLEELRKLLRARQAANNALVAIVDGTGRPVVSSLPLHWERLGISGAPGAVHVVRDTANSPWAYSEAPLHLGTRADNTFYLVYAAQRPDLLGDNDFLISYFAIPIAALVIASAGIWLGTNRAILRWISDLRAIASEVGRGEYRVPALQFAGAPVEVRGLATELRRMARLIARRDRTLQQGIQQQKALTHELHHRVRNNLQVIGSFLALRESQVRDPSTSLALSEARLHVGLLGAVYRLLYDRGELTPVRLDQLLEAIMPLLRRELAVEIRFEVEGRAGLEAVDIDTAIAIALWSLQALLLLSDHCPERHPPIGGSLSAGRDGAVLCFKTEDRSDWDDDPISVRMLDGLSRQIGATSTDDTSTPGLRTICLRWAPRTSRGQSGPDHRLSSADPASLRPPGSSRTGARSSRE